MFQTEIMPGPTTTAMGLGQLNARCWAWLQTPANLGTVLATTRYGNGRFAEIRLYPLDLGRNRHGSQMGTPRVPDHDVAQRILKDLQDFSRPFNTVIETDGDVGVIRISAAAAGTPAEGRQQAPR